MSLSYLLILAVDMGTRNGSCCSEAGLECWGAAVNPAGNAVLCDNGGEGVRNTFLGGWDARELGRCWDTREAGRSELRESRDAEFVKRPWRYTGRDIAEDEGSLPAERWVDILMESSCTSGDNLCMFWENREPSGPASGKDERYPLIGIGEFMEDSLSNTCGTCKELWLVAPRWGGSKLGQTISLSGKLMTWPSGCEGRTLENVLLSGGALFLDNRCWMKLINSISRLIDPFTKALDSSFRKRFSKRVARRVMELWGRRERAAVWVYRQGTANLCHEYASKDSGSACCIEHSDRIIALSDAGLQANWIM